LQKHGALEGKIMRRSLRDTLVVVLVVIVAAFLIRAHSAPTSVDIMAGSSLISNIIQDVAGDKMETRSLIPADVCPGHYDLMPSDIEALANSTALFIHDYQQNFQNIKGAIEAAENQNLTVTVINVTGNWMVPSVQAEAVDKIAQALEQLDPTNAAYYQQRAAEREQAILTYGDQVKNTLQEAGVDGVKVICADMQADFVEWAGFDVVATFGRPEDLSPADVTQLLTEANQADAALVIDNLQSGSTTLGAALEPDIEAIPVTISNFPGGFANTETWEKAIDENVNLLLAALSEWRAQHG
jgi:ABC-type Zn uptake system ZnuABC Zn-binding protein ZnuA